MQLLPLKILVPDEPLQLGKRGRDMEKKELINF